MASTATLAFFYRTTQAPHWAAPVLCGFKHVSCAVHHGDDFWTYHDFGPEGLTGGVFYGPVESILEDVSADVTLMGRRRYRIQTQLPVILNSCVGHTKAMLGVSSYAITPSQLYRHLLRLDYCHAVEFSRRGQPELPVAAAPAACPSATSSPGGCQPGDLLP